MKMRRGFVALSIVAASACGGMIGSTEDGGTSKDAAADASADSSSSPDAGADVTALGQL